MDRKPYKLPEFETLKNQICRCIVFGFYIAAMTLINHLLEKFVKFSLIYGDTINEKEDGEEEIIKLVDDLAESTKKFDDKNLGQNIETLYKMSLINEGEKKALIKMKDHFRNAYSHCDRGKMYGGLKANIQEAKGDAESLKILEGKLGELPQREELLSNIPFADAIIVNEKAMRDCVPYLKELDVVIRNVEVRLFPNQEI